MASIHGKMGQPVWIKRVGDANAAASNVDYCAGFDMRGRPEADARLALHDLNTNAAHLLMLVETGIVPAEAGSDAARALVSLRDRAAAGENLLRPGAEDIHMSIESWVTEIVGGEAGGRLHTARSRNDQVATDMRLWLRDEITAYISRITVLAHGIADHARVHVNTVCPGMTHGQPAMVTSWGHWTMSYLPRLVRDMRAAAALLDDLDTCPLGAAASFGTSWPINRRRAAELLGFRGPTESGADGIWSRGEMEARYAFVLALHLAHLAGIGQDLILLSTPPRAWLRLADEHVTGSSIMPQKRNPDFAEVTRARAAVANGIVQSLAGIGATMYSGYNRDTQWTKYLVFDAADNAAGAPKIYTDVFARLSVDRVAMRTACDIGFLMATDVADYLARSRRIPFRQCYRILGAAVRECDVEGRLVREKLNSELAREGLDALTEAEWEPLGDAAKLLVRRDQPGNPAPGRTSEAIDGLLSEVDGIAGVVDGRTVPWAQAMNRLWVLMAELGK